MSVEPQAQGGPEIENLLAEERTFPPDPAFVAQANATADLYEAAEADYDRVLGRPRPASGCRGRGPSARRSSGTSRSRSGSSAASSTWPTTASTGTSRRGLGDKVAYHWIGEPGDTRTITYADLLRESSKAANALLELGVRKGDRVAIYMPMIPELPIAMLACARIGAPHTVVFGGFSAEALSRPHQRLRREGPDHRRRRLAARQAGRRSSPRPTRPSRARPRSSTSSSSTGSATARRMVAGRDVWWHEIVDRQSPVCPPVPVDSEHMLYLLYTSGTTAKPKGILHTSAGYLLGASFTHWAVFDIKPDDVYWCAADIGWVTGHSYIVYGPLANATTGVLYEGAPDTPDLGPLVADRRGLQGHDPVLRADRDPRVHEAGRAVSRRA